MVNAPKDGGTMSMTGFAALRGTDLGYDCAWDIRSVNGKGFDLRLRLPDWIEGLEPALRLLVAARVNRGNVSIGLKITQTGGDDALRVNRDGLAAALAAVKDAEAAAAALGVSLRPASVADVIAMRGVLDQGGTVIDTAPLLAKLMRDAEKLLDDFVAMRAAEGRSLNKIIATNLDKVAGLSVAARAVSEARRPMMEQALRDNLDRVLASAAEADPARVAQELALLIVKADVTEELDRLDAHIDAARDLLSVQGAVGRKFDFLMQEFMREVNTLCAKSGNTDLTRIGLDLKTVVDQMREQVQNVE
ncbi:MAG: YicC/YloC family endoribonuclease [Albidovulum sp.]